MLLLRPLISFYFIHFWLVYIPLDTFRSHSEFMLIYTANSYYFIPVQLARLRLLMTSHAIELPEQVLLTVV